MPSGFLTPALVILAAAALQGFCGFGYSLLAMPILLFLMPASTAVPILCITGIALNAVLLGITRKSLNLRGLFPLALAGVLFTPLGALLIREIDAETAKTVMGVCVTLLSVTMLSKLRAGVRKTAAGMFATGAVSGLLNGFSTFSGPPVVLMLSGSGDERDGIRSSLAAYFLLLGVIAAVSYSMMGVLTSSALPTIALTLPFAVLGGSLGAVFARRPGNEIHRRISLVVMALLGLLSAAA